MDVDVDALRTPLLEQECLTLRFLTISSHEIDETQALCNYTQLFCMTVIPINQSTVST